MEQRSTGIELASGNLTLSLVAQSKLRTTSKEVKINIKINPFPYFRLPPPPLYYYAWPAYL
jgi:hypothetical protein